MSNFLESSDDRVERFWFLCSVHAPAEVPSSALDLRHPVNVVENGWEWMRMVKMASKNGEHFGKIWQNWIPKKFWVNMFWLPGLASWCSSQFCSQFCRSRIQVGPIPTVFLSKSIYPFSSCETHTFSISLPSYQGNVPVKVWQRHTVCRDLRTTSPISASPGPRFHAAVVDRLATTMNRCQPSPPFESF